LNEGARGDEAAAGNTEEDEDEGFTQREEEKQDGI